MNNTLILTNNSVQFVPVTSQPIEIILQEACHQTNTAISSMSWAAFGSNALASLALMILALYYFKESRTVCAGVIIIGMLNLTFSGILTFYTQAFMSP